tara:strand:+ start:434 stop:634 length:201 start_codon:yes stop_codon:yes gene_type:complete
VSKNCCQAIYTQAKKTNDSINQDNIGFTPDYLKTKSSKQTLFLLFLYLLFLSDKINLLIIFDITTP